MILLIWAEYIRTLRPHTYLERRKYTNNRRCHVCSTGNSVGEDTAGSSTQACAADSSKVGLILSISFQIASRVRINSSRTKPHRSATVDGLFRQYSMWIDAYHGHCWSEYRDTWAFPWSLRMAVLQWQGVEYFQWPWTLNRWKANQSVLEACQLRPSRRPLQRRKETYWILHRKTSAKSLNVPALGRSPAACGWSF